MQISPIDWTTKSLVRKRFEILERKKLIGKGFSLSDYQKQLEKIQQELKLLEAIAGG